MKKPRPIFTRASGASYSDEDIQLIGAELYKIAQKHKVDDIRLIDKKIVFNEIKTDPQHPLRRFYDWDVQKAAEKHWVEHTQKLIMSVRVEYKIGKFVRPLPFTLSADLPRARHGTVRKRVLTEDALRNDPVFASAVGIRLRNIDTHLAQLETIVAAHGRGPAGVDELLERLRGAFDAYYSSIEVAAE